MTSKITGSILGLALAVLTSSVAGAATIAGPALTNNDSTYSVTGLEFHALGNATLTGFTFQNQGLADMADLVSTTGTILHSVSIPAGTAPDVVSGLTWSLTSGTSYWLLQTTLNNGKFFFLDGGLFRRTLTLQLYLAALLAPASRPP